jgi:chromosome segregation ATPase
MIDYNKKFQELNNKIARITEETRNKNRAINHFYSKLEQIENKSNSKLSYIDKSLTSLKDYYTKISSEYEKYLKSSKKNNIGNTIKEISNQIDKNIQIQKNEMINYIN